MTLWAAVATEKTSFFKFMVLSLSRKSFCQDVFQPSFPNQHFFSRHTMTGWNLKITFLAKKHIIFLNLSKPTMFRVPIFNQAVVIRCSSPKLDPTMTVLVARPARCTHLGWLRFAGCFTFECHPGEGGDRR